MLLFFFFGVSFLFLQRFFVRAQSTPRVTETNFTVSDSAVSATNVTYTLEFKFSEQFDGGSNAGGEFNLNRITRQGGDNDSNMDSATGTVASFQYEDPSGSWNDIAYSTFQKNISSDLHLLIYTFGGITTTIPANKTIKLVVNGVTNPNKAGWYGFSVELRDNDGTEFMVLPYDHPSRTVRAEIGDYCLKVKVTDPSGATAIGGLNFWAYAGDNSFNGFLQTDYHGLAVFYFDSFNNRDTCPSGTSEKVYLEVNIPFEYSNPNHYVAPDPMVAELSADKDKYYNDPIKLVQATKTISGNVSYRGGGGVANATVNAFRMNGQGFSQTTTDSSGNYTLYVSGGSWGVTPQQSGSSDWAYGDKPGEVVFANNNSSESKTINFVVDRATATIRGRLVKPGGTPVNPGSDKIGGVGVFSQEGKGGSDQLDSDGSFSIRVPAGTYNFNVWAPPGSQYGPPKNWRELMTRFPGLKLTLLFAMVLGFLKP